MTGFFTSPQSQPQVPTAVEKVPGITNLGTSLMDRFMKILSGNKAQTPYTGYNSVFGGQGGTFPGNYKDVNPVSNPNPNTIPSASFQQLIQQMIQQAISSAGGGGSSGIGMTQKA